MRDYDQAIHSDPNDSNASYNRAFVRGVAHFDEGSHNNAIQAFTEALQIDPKSAKAYTARGGTYMLKGEHDQALNDITEAIRLDSNSADSYYTRGAVYADKGEYNRARRDLNKALELGADRAMVEEVLSRLPG